MQKARGYDGMRQRMGREPCRMNLQYGKRALGKAGAPLQSTIL